MLSGAAKERLGEDFGADLRGFGERRDAMGRERATYYCRLGALRRER